ncbi:gluconate 2-dehydrogenase subunit 3 family protein [Hymenobacter aerilatus]|uniref:Gluconate 2-dehydrogenase subunit 3 family protein n=1 Tax=Hymenobacter aerilatus TaxID=2932251 RepID=A0A8T9SY98_9BACT|nr:gluconate 2-dehydrogenase subunit 3 family protein [Hymenobacter aerilatus]UOR05894.1 gluconate 2-dehydrogenase subunit 3 family protein [Hymenobacter aerilatus]
MKRRDSLKAIGLTALSTGLLLDSCKSDTDNKQAATTKKAASEEDNAGREAFEVERNKKLHAETFFTKHEMATITVLGDIIIPKDEKSGSASDAGVPDFIEFIVKDIPTHQVPMRGGLRWLDVQCSNRYGKPFVECSQQQQLEMVTAIAYPMKAKPEMAPGVTFFNRMRDLTATGFFTSKIGIADIGYAGNAPNRWMGVPEDVLKQYGMENVKV